MNATSRQAAESSRRASPQRLPALIGRDRRGVLLLIVLSMLTLFMMLGAAYLVVATRSRETARAYAKLSLRNDNVRLPHSQIFDTVMLRVLRGVPAGQNVNVSLAQPEPPGVTIAPFESLLADKYGGDLPDSNGNYTIALSGTAETDNGNPVVYEQAPVLVLPRVTLDSVPQNLNAPFAATDLAGRVITILGTGRDPSSHRILRATGKGRGPYQIIVDNQPRNRPYERVAGQSCRVVVNGREFIGSGTATQTNESWDGFDNFNPFLAWVAPRDLQNQPLDTAGPFIGTGSQALPVSVSSSVVRKAGFVTTSSDLKQLNSGTNGFSFGADNDNDGVNDGFFLDFGLPTVISPNGDQVTLHASVLVLDLDGRVNVNAHGSLVPIVYPHTVKSGTNSYWTAPPGVSIGTLHALPTGSGYGPPEVNIDLLFPSGTSTAATYKDERLQGLTRSFPAENPTVYLRTGVDQVRLTDSVRSGRSPGSSRFYFSGGTASTPQLMNCEGRYGNFKGNVASRFSPTIIPGTAQLSTGTSFYRNFVLPGIPEVNDAASSINDYKPFQNPTPLHPQVASNTEYLGIPPSWWNISGTFNWTKGTSVGAGISPVFPRQIYNCPPDLHGRMKVFTAGPSTTGKPPRVVYIKPEWSSDNYPEAETRDDPYELRLDTRAPRNSWLKSYGRNSPYGNLFNLSELENILRPYDIDSTKLPPRLEAMLGSVSEEARLRITTDSWDSTVVSGTAAQALFDWSRNLSVTLGHVTDDLYGAKTARNHAVLDGVLNREIARGERFDLNRPLTGTKPAKYDINDAYYAQRQAYFKDLYVLLCALTPPADFNARNCAQWVANIVEFRDGDSTMTPFEFDTNPADGWDVDGDVKSTNDAKPAQRDVVFGCERPEVVIAEACAWENETTGGLYICLQRPWNATAYGTNDKLQQKEIPGEPCDSELDSYSNTLPQNKVELARKSGALGTDLASRSKLPIWRLRIKTKGQQDTFIRLDIDDKAPAAKVVLPPELGLVVPAVGPAPDTAIGVDSSKYIVPEVGNPAFVTVPADAIKIPELKVPGPKASFKGEPRDATVFLERLIDPKASIEATDTDPDIAADWQMDPEQVAAAAITPDQFSRSAIYRIVDQALIKVANLCLDPDTNQIPPLSFPKLTHRGDSLWRQGTPGEPTAIPVNLSGSWQVKSPLWFFWPNRPFVASPELLFVHALDSQALLTKYSDPSPEFAPDADTNNWTWGPTVLRNLKSPPIFDAVHVPTRFAGIHGTTSDPSGNLATLAGIDQVTTPVNQFSAFREPGRVNLNTVTADDVWHAVVAGPLVKPTDGSPDPVSTRSQADLNGTPARNTSSLLALAGQQPAANAPQPMPKADANATLKPAIDLNPSQAIYTANRLANTATTRSHLFGVWITLREAMAPAPAAGQPVVPADPDGVRYHRAFYVIDRSIPVAHEPGRDHNVWDAVLLRRIVE